MRRFKIKIKFPAFPLNFLFTVFLCSSCTITIPTSTIEETETYGKNEETAVQPNNNPQLNILYDDITIDGKTTYRGQELDVEPGVIEIAFNGEIPLPVTSEAEDSNAQKTAETVDFFACLTFLPICALTRPNIFTKRAIKHEVLSKCNGKSEIILQSDSEYNISVLKITDAMPQLTVTRVTEPSYNIVEQELACNT